MSFLNVKENGLNFPFVSQSEVEFVEPEQKVFWCVENTFFVGPELKRSDRFKIYVDLVVVLCYSNYAGLFVSY